MYNLNKTKQLYNSTSEEEILEEDILEEVEDDYSLNMPCDNAGFCIGADCKQYWECNS